MGKRTDELPEHLLPENVQQRAAELLVRIDLQKTPEAFAEAESWMAEHPINRSAFIRMSVAWRQSDILKRLVMPGSPADEDLLVRSPPPPSLARSAPRARHMPQVAPLPRPQLVRNVSRATPQRRLLQFAAAAGLAALLFVAGAGLIRYQSGGQSYSTAVGDFARIPMSDGTVVSLNTNSEVRVRYWANRRTVTLVRGEAMFEVAHDKARPFDVTAGDTTVRAVGTQFSVRLRSRRAVDILLSEGVISVNSPFQSKINAGAFAWVRDGRVTTKALAPEDITRKLAWTGGTLIFNGETLAEAVAEMNRYNRVQLEIANPTIAITRIGGAFRANNLDGFVAALKATFPVRARVDKRYFGPDVIRLDGDAT